MKFNHFTILRFAVFDVEAHESPDLLPSLIAGSAGIDVQKIQFLVKHYLKDMTVSVDHQIDPLFFKEGLHSARPFPRITADVGQEHAHSITLEDIDFRTASPDLTVIYVAADGADDSSGFFAQTFDY